MQLLPSGKFDLNDRRGPWVVKDMASVIERSRRHLEPCMPVDMDRAMDRHKETEAPAAGWIEELAAHDDCIWSRIAWATDRQGEDRRAEIPRHRSRREGDEGGRGHAIIRAGLTNTPSIAPQLP